MDIQKQVRDNAEDLQNYLLDLKSWEKDMRQKEEDLKLAQITYENIEQDVPPIRNSLSRSKKKSRHKKNDKNASPKKRIPGNDYKAWDAFDAEKELQKMDVGDEESKQLSASDSSDEEEFYAKKRKQLAILNKDKGNEFFKKGDYDSAINSYTAGIQLDPENPLLAANRAMALIKKGQFQAAENDCILCLSIDPTYVKAYLRRGTARNNLGKYSLAKDDFSKVLELEPDNKQAQSELKKLNMETVESLMDIIQVEEEKNQEFQPENLSKIITNCSQKPSAAEKASMSNQIQCLFPDSKPIHPVQKPDLNINEDSFVEKEVSELNENDFKKKTGLCETTPKVEKMNFQSSDMENIISILEQTLPPVPTASFQFLTDWQKLSRYPDLKYQYLKQLPPEKLAVIFKHSMEPELFPDILHTLSTSFLENGDDVFDYLKYLAEVGRFNTMLMFLSAEEQTDLNLLLEHIKKSDRSSSITEHLLKFYKS